MPNPENLIPARAGEIRNPTGKPKGTRNRSTIARMVLSMRGEFPDKIYEVLRETYPDLPRFADLEFIATVMQVDKAINGKDTAAYNAVISSAYGNATQTVEMRIGTDAEEMEDEYVD